jgi:hypothetical protein
MNTPNYWPSKIRTFDKERASKFFGNPSDRFTSLQDLVCTAVTEKLDQLEKQGESKN